MVITPAISFVTYYPDRGVLDRIGFALELGFSVFVFDNTPGGSEVFKNAEQENLFLMGSGKNVGLGMALHKMMQAIAEKGFWSVFYFDQDTLFTKATMEWLKQWLMVNDTSLKAGVAIWNFTNSTVPLSPAEAIIRPGYLLVSSGSLFQLDVLNKLGWHNPNYFLECIDYELCARALYAGFALVEVGGCVGIDHLSLQPVDSLQLMGRKCYYRLYSLRRTWSFGWGLFVLGIRSFFRGQWIFGLKCLRNIATHVLMQIRALTLRFLQVICKGK
jgi:hypothetical protein